MTVISGKKHRQDAGEIGLPTEEDSVPGNEDIVKDSHRISHTEEIFRFDILAFSRCRDTNYLLDAGCVGRNRKCDGPIGILVGHQAGGYGYDLI